ncbi:MAG: hypothetical protein K5660_07620 [Paludibacteraceae bacterium]|nr:hypothetical protein [Paludibacteraceae bacterium]
MSKIGNWIHRLSNSIGDALQENNQPVVGTPSVESPADKEVETSAVEKNEKGVVHEQKYEESAPAQKNNDSQEKKEEHIESRDALIRSVINTLQKVVEYKDTTVGKKLVIWLACDKVTFENYDTEQYKQRVLIALVNERGYGFDEIAFCIGFPAEEVYATKVGQSNLEYLQILAHETFNEVKTCKAIISIFGGAGSLLQEQYLLSSNDMKKKMLTSYNIGSGQFPRIPTGYRENHIAIDDNPNSPMAEKNKYVSRMHAHIGFSEKFGFYFQVEKDGTRLMGKRTRIFRGEEKIECDNPQAKIPLQTGDLIELGKAVVLRYMQIDE